VFHRFVARFGFTVSDDESPAGAGFWCLTLLRLMGVSLSFPFGPLLLAVRSASSRRVAFPAGALAARIASADFSLHHAASPFQAQSEISPGKGHGFPRAAVGSTSAPLGRKGLRSSVRSPWLPAPHIHHTRFVDLERVLPVRRLAVSLPASFSAVLTVGPVAGFFALRVRLRFSATCHLRGLSPPIHAHAGHTRSRLRGSLRPSK